MEGSKNLKKSLEKPSTVKLSKLNGQRGWVGVSRTRFSVSIEVKFRDDFSSERVSKTPGDPRGRHARVKLCGKASENAASRGNK